MACKVTLEHVANIGKPLNPFSSTRSLKFEGNLKREFAET